MDGRVFRRFIWMNERCPRCGLVFEREPGYFTGAMYVSYAIGILATAPVYFVMLYLGTDAWVILAVTATIVAVLFPLLFRYSRVFWMHLDRAVNPGDAASDGAPEPAPPDLAGQPPHA